MQSTTINIDRCAILDSKVLQQLLLLTLKQLLERLCQYKKWHVCDHNNVLLMHRRTLIWHTS